MSNRAAELDFVQTEQEKKPPQAAKPSVNPAAVLAVAQRHPDMIEEVEMTLPPGMRAEDFEWE